MRGERDGQAACAPQLFGAGYENSALAHTNTAPAQPAAAGRAWTRARGSRARPSAVGAGTARAAARLDRRRKLDAADRDPVELLDPGGAAGAWAGPAQSRRTGCGRYAR